MKQLLTEQNYIDAAKLLNCEVAAIKAVAEVESRGAGFNSDDRPKILFEGHWFYKYTNGMYVKDYPTICYQKWTNKFYFKDQKDEWDKRYLVALGLNKKAAMLSTSWGKFQIMGFNHGICGFTTVESFVLAQNVDENEHLKAFCNYVKHEYLDDELRELRWADFAKRYNGPEYKKNQYDVKLDKAYKKYKG